ncbi:hypothetical protein HanXRQr2_Chr10g0454881 [Helianthus annuus]|uniref:Uncharacterized protein n=1 Tax=Helianthus annuus TaxID=4232 RepID=A0A9K3HZ41_HELAN|nr:hypothetical protein HanXRQr2_Chr10g0454881 [Helianthus annuus]
MPARCRGYLCLRGLTPTQHNSAYHGSFNASFPHPCFVQFPTILSSRMMISENFGLIVKSGYQHSSL